MPDEERNRLDKILRAILDVGESLDPELYADAVLTLIFFKGATELCKGRSYPDIAIAPGGSFDDVAAAPCGPRIGTVADRALRVFRESNPNQAQLLAHLPRVSFEDEALWGPGGARVQNVAALIGCLKDPFFSLPRPAAPGPDSDSDSDSEAEPINPFAQAFEALAAIFAQRILDARATRPRGGRAATRNASEPSGARNASAADATSASDEKSREEKPAEKPKAGGEEGGDSLEESGQWAWDSLVAPENLAKLMAALAKSAARGAPSLHDPFCRDGSFAADVAAALPGSGSDFDSLNIPIYGRTDNRRRAAWAWMNLSLRGRGTAEIRGSNAQAEPWAERGRIERFDRVFCFLPQGAVAPPQADAQGARSGLFAAWAALPQQRPEWAWVMLAAESLKKGGAAVLALPSACLSRSNKQEALLRRRVLEEKIVAGVVALPDKLVEGRDDALCLLILDPGAADRRGGVVMIDAAKLGQTDGKRPALGARDVFAIARAYRKVQPIEGFCRVVSWGELISAREGDLDLRLYFRDPESIQPEQSAESLLAHCLGGAPTWAIDRCGLWRMFPNGLKDKLFEPIPGRKAMRPLFEAGAAPAIVANDARTSAQKKEECETLFRRWVQNAPSAARANRRRPNPGALAERLAESIGDAFEAARVLRPADAAEALLLSWSAGGAKGDGPGGLGPEPAWADRTQRLLEQAFDSKIERAASDLERRIELYRRPLSDREIAAFTAKTWPPIPSPSAGEGAGAGAGAREGGGEGSEIGLGPEPETKPAPSAPPEAGIEAQRGARKRRAAFEDALDAFTSGARPIPGADAERFRLVSLARAARICLGNTPRGGAEDPLGTPFFQQTDANGRSFFIDDCARRVRWAKTQSVAWAQAGDLLLEGVSSLKPFMLSLDGCASKAFLVIHPQPDVADGLYLLFALSARSAQEQIQERASSSSTPRISQNRLETVRIRLPGLAAQKAIAARLLACLELLGPTD